MLYLLALLLATTALTAAVSESQMWAQPAGQRYSNHSRRFFIADDRFMVQEANSTAAAPRPVSLYAGEIHYTRVPRQLWGDRLARLRALGLNALQTYVPWNYHEPVNRAAPEFRRLDELTAFLALAGEMGFYVTVRAGPYMCGEWEFGGLPAWLLENGTIPLRTDAAPYIGFAARWWTALLRRAVAPALYARGGPVVMVQVENEYGSYGDVTQSAADRRYLERLVAIARAELGEDAILMTTDGGDAAAMARGSLPGGAVYTAGDGCTDPAPAELVAMQRRMNAPGRSPFMCTEF